MEAQILCVQRAIGRLDDKRSDASTIALAEDFGDGPFLRIALGAEGLALGCRGGHVPGPHMPT
jgi:hypothetical protein